MLARSWMSSRHRTVLVRQLQGPQRAKKQRLLEWAVERRALRVQVARRRCLLQAGHCCRLELLLPRSRCQGSPCRATGRSWRVSERRSTASWIAAGSLVDEKIIQYPAGRPAPSICPSDDREAIVGFTCVRSQFAPSRHPGSTHLLILDCSSLKTKMSPEEIDLRSASDSLSVVLGRIPRRHPAKRRRSRGQEARELEVVSSRQAARNK